MGVAAGGGIFGCTDPATGTRGRNDSGAGRPEQPFEWFTPGTAQFNLVFPHLCSLRRPQSAEQLQKRAYGSLRAKACVVLRTLGGSAGHLGDEVTQNTIVRIEDQELIDRHDPARGDMDDYLFGIIRRVALETLRDAARLKLTDQVDSVVAGKRDPLQEAEFSELLDMTKEWVEELPEPYRGAVARKFLGRRRMTNNSARGTEQKAGASTEFVHRHRAVKRLRQRASRQGFRP